MIRFFDILISISILLLFSPFLILIILLIRFDSKGNTFFGQDRVGKGHRIFKLYKFRTMVSNAEKKGLQLTIGHRDDRITRIGYFLRKYKLDELPQFYNVLKGQMSIVGPRPEVQKYVNLYTEKQQAILKVKPGITDYASIQFVNENQILAQSENPEKTYIEDIIPIKLKLNLKYIQNKNLWEYFKIIALTLKHIIFV